MLKAFQILVGGVLFLALIPGPLLLFLLQCPSLCKLLREGLSGVTAQMVSQVYVREADGRAEGQVRQKLVPAPRLVRHGVFLELLQTDVGEGGWQTGPGRSQGDRTRAHSASS